MLRDHTSSLLKKINNGTHKNIFIHKQSHTYTPNYAHLFIIPIDTYINTIIHNDTSIPLFTKMYYELNENKHSILR